LAAGSYTVEAIMTMGVDTCNRTVTAVVNNKTVDNNPIDISVTNITAATCMGGGNNGSAIITVTGNVTSIIVDGSISIANGLQISGLSAGAHTVTVYFASPGCTNAQMSTTFDIPSTSGITVVVESQTNTTCGTATGSIILSASPAGSYSLSTSTGIVNGMEVKNLPAGTHVIVVTNTTTGCEERVTVAITNTNMSGSINVTTTGISCAGSPGSYTLAITGSITQIKVDGVIVTAGTHSAGAGTHYVEFTDNTGCVGYAMFDIASSIAMNVTYVSNTADCQSSSFYIDVVVTGGTAPYVIDGIVSATGVLRLDNLLPGHISIKVVDANGCEQVFDNIRVGDCYIDCDLFAISALAEGSDCNSATGKINASALGVSAGAIVRYSLNGSAWQLSSEFNNLVAGTYTLRAIMTVGVDTCYTETAVVVSNKVPDSNIINISVSNIVAAICTGGGANGSARINVTGNVTGITVDGVAITNGQTVNGLTAGTHVVTAMFASSDCNNSQTSTTFVVPSESGITLSATGQTNTTCGNSTGAVTI
jgi:hypothetical protein